MFRILTLLALVILVLPISAQSPQKRNQQDKFRQLEEILPTPNQQRTASGAPGPQYWQQQADLDISVELDDEKQAIKGTEKITYTNKSPDPLRYIWLQLDNNIFKPDSDAALTSTTADLSQMSFDRLKAMLLRETFDGGLNITSVVDADKKPLKHTIVKTMMRIDLAKPLKTDEKTVVSIDWNFRINDARMVRGRTGYEFFKDDGNYLYEMAHWYPRLAAYTDVNGWQHKQYLGSGEFTLEFGNYTLNITVPDDHVVAATGVLQNPKEVMTEEQLKRWETAKKSDKPVFIVTPAEAKETEKKKSPKGKKTWKYKADNVRDVAFASSRKFIWDALGHKVGENIVMCMSYYPNEGEPLWSKYSTRAVAHTLDVYSKFTFDYPYPVAISVNGPIGGMEYPMICFNGPRPEKDGTYSKRTKYGLISVVIHEVGHNYFPMIVNSDERQWTWMDEGINTFLQHLAEQEWEENYPSSRGEPSRITGYMKSIDQVPIMTNSESVLQLGNNAYAKPATALNILRETILGRELFDHAFKEYANRWKFKRPQPSDFFRTMEDASGIDLDWFWRGWFYSIDHVDISIEQFRAFTIDTKDPQIEKYRKKEEKEQEPTNLSKERNKDLPKLVDKYPDLKDFYNALNEFEVTEQDRKSFDEFLKRLTEEEKKLLQNKSFFYVVDFKNIGGLVMPILLEMEFEDGTRKEVRIPAEVWRYNNEKVSKLFITEKPIKKLTLDPHLETADVDTENNHYPRQIQKSRFELFKMERQPRNEMQRAKGGDPKKDGPEEEQPRRKRPLKKDGDDE